MPKTEYGLVATGHLEIDRQHGELARLIGQLSLVCAQPTGSCRRGVCPLELRRDCEQRLIDLLGQLYGLVVDHFFVEERQMRSALTDPQLAAFVAAHVADHAEIVRHLTELTYALETQSPAHNAAYLHGLVERWLGGHGERFDAPLASLLQRDGEQRGVGDHAPRPAIDGSDVK